MDEVLEELSVALHELQAGSDELREQNERLLVAENRLSEERRRYQELFEFGPDGYLVTTATAVIREANRMAAALLGVALLGALLNSRLWVALPADAIDHDALLNSAARDAKVIEKMRLRIWPNLIMCVL